MADEEIDNGFESLFRNKLEDNEMAVNSDLAGRFMRRLERREFLRFSPTRLNIWYVIAAAASVVVAGLLLSGPTQDDTGPLPPQQDLTPASVAATDTVTLKEDSEAYRNAAVTVAAGHTVPPAAEAESAAGGDTPRHDAISTPESEGPMSIAVRQEGSDKLSVTSHMKDVSIEASVTSGCVPLHVRFTARTAGSHKVTWSFGDGGSSSDENPYYIYDIPGTYRVTLIVTDSRGHVAGTTALIEAWGRPRASFEIRNNDAPGENDRLQFVNTSEGAVRYLWDFGDGTFSGMDNPSRTYDHVGRFDVKLVAWSANGCADSVTVSDVVNDDGLFLRFPNAFVPNTAGPTGGYYNQRTDEQNQVFHPIASGVDSYNLKIYSKAGMLVFESNDPAMGWDGYYKGQLCGPGVYVWKVRGTYRNGQPIIMAGDVTLINY